MGWFCLTSRTVGEAKLLDPGAVKKEHNLQRAPEICLRNGLAHVVEIKPSTARRQPTTSPKSSGNPVRASTSPYRSETTLLRLTTPSPDMPRVVMRTTAVSRYPCGTATERLMPRERTTTLDSRSDTPKLSFQPRATGDNGSTAGPSRATTTRTTTTTQLPNTGILDERAGLCRQESKRESGN